MTREECIALMTMAGFKHKLDSASIDVFVNEKIRVSVINIFHPDSDFIKRFGLIGTGYSGGKLWTATCPECFLFHNMPFFVNEGDLLDALVVRAARYNQGET